MMIRYRGASINPLAKNYQNLTAAISSLCRPLNESPELKLNAGK